MDLTLPQLTAGLLVIVAAGLDLRDHRIPNWLSYGGILLGLLLGAMIGGAGGFASAALGFLAGFLPLLLIYMGGGLGAGDVKLMGAVGALLGWPLALNALIASMIAGGFCAALILLWQGRLLGILRYCASRVWGMIYQPHITEPLPEHKDSFPFGVAIALGVLLTLAPLVLGYNSPADLVR